MILKKIITIINLEKKEKVKRSTEMTAKADIEEK